MFKFFFILLVLFSMTCVAQSDESFEGIIEYNIEILFVEDTPTNYREYFEQKFGTTLIAYHDSSGDIKREYRNSGNSGYDFHYFEAATNYYYAKDKDIDTVFFYNASLNPFKLIKKEIQKETQEEIFGKSCKSISFQGISQVGEQIATATYFYSGEPFIDSKLYVKWKDYFTDEFFSASNSPYLKYILKAKYFDLIITASKIEERDLPAEIFKLPQGVLVKEKKPW